jgi:hypothetical protein
MKAGCHQDTQVTQNGLPARGAVDESTSRTYVFWATQDSLLQRKQLALKGLPQKLTLLAGLLTAFLLLAGGGAFAHGSHPHVGTVEPHRTANLPPAGEASRAVATRSAEVRLAPTNKAPSRVPTQSSDTDCCCGGLVCHAGLTFPAALVPLPDARAERVVPEPSSSVEERVPSGLERPPRGRDSV